MFTLDEVERRSEIHWRFETRNYVVIMWAEDEELSPEGQFDDARDVAFASQDIFAHWFCAFVGVFDLNDGNCLGYDVLGGCSYTSFEEFCHSHHWQYQRAGARQGKWLKNNKHRHWKRYQASGRAYFGDMVREAIREARTGLTRRIAA